MESRRDMSPRRRAGWSSSSMDRHFRRPERNNNSPLFRNDERWSRRRHFWSSRDEEDDERHYRDRRRRRSSSLNASRRRSRRHHRERSPSSRSRCRHYYPSPPRRRKQQHSPSPYEYRRGRSKSTSPYSPQRKRRRRRSDSREYDRHYSPRRSDRYYMDESTYRRSRDGDGRHRQESRRPREELSDRPLRRRRHHRRRERSSTSSSSIHGDDAPPAPQQQQHARHAVRAGVVSDDEELEVHCKSVDSKMVQKDPPPKKKRSGSAMSASSNKDDTVGHFKGGPGTVVANRYRITRDVGLGTFGRVVECVDLKKRKSRSRGGSSRSSGERGPHRERRVAIKIVRNVKRYYESALIEADIVKDVNRRGGRGTSHCGVLHNAFTFSGHFCLVFENLGPSLYDFLKRHNYQPFPMVCLRPFCRQLLEALEFLHSFRLIHTDLKPENLLLTNFRERPYKWRGKTYIIPESSDVKVIDFGGATYDDEKKSSVVNTRQYRAPEVILGLGWSTPSDLWSAGCILAELYMGELLFATHDNIEHVALMERIIGPFSRRMLKRARSSPIAQRAFDASTGRHLVGAVLGSESTSFVENVSPLESLIRKEDGRFLDMLKRLLVVDPNERAPASELAQFDV